MPEHVTGFQSLCRGTAIATKEYELFLGKDRLVSIPLSRDSHCNERCSGNSMITTSGFNPSVEGQPLQPKLTLTEPNGLVTFQSLCRGTAIATCLSSSINFGVSTVSIPLSRDSHCNMGNLWLRPLTATMVSIPLSRDSHCNL